MAVLFQIRRARPADAAALERVERRCFGDPWSAASFRSALRSPGGFGFIAEARGELAGYLIGREIAGTGEVLNLAVVPPARRQGIGRALLEAGLAAFTSRSAEEVFLEVRESNRVAQALYRSYGFSVSGQRARYYRNPTEDAIVLRLQLNGSA